MLPFQAAVKRKYGSPVIEIGVAVLIGLNFVVSALEAQIRLPATSPEQIVFKVFEWFFGVVFTVELIVNIYGDWFFAFWSSAWNWFDFVIVLISVASLVGGDLPGLSVLRLFRAFRVFRLFKRVKSLRIIIEGFISAVPGVSNVALILGLITAIWAIMGVQFFGAGGETYERTYFMSFFPACLTLFQIWTGDSWGGIARAMILEEGVSAALFFVAFVLIGSIIMTNAVIAVLIQGFMVVVVKQQMEDEDRAEKEKHAREGHHQDDHSDDGHDHDHDHGHDHGHKHAHEHGHEHAHDPHAVPSRIEHAPQLSPSQQAATVQHSQVPSSTEPARSSEEARGFTPRIADELVARERDTPVGELFRRVSGNVLGELAHARARLDALRELAKSRRPEDVAKAWARLEAVDVPACALSNSETMLSPLRLAGLHDGLSPPGVEAEQEQQPGPPPSSEIAPDPLRESAEEIPTHPAC